MHILVETVHAITILPESIEMPPDAKEHYNGVFSILYNKKLLLLFLLFPIVKYSKSHLFEM